MLQNSGPRAFGVSVMPHHAVGDIELDCVTKRPDRLRSPVQSIGAMCLFALQNPSLISPAFVHSLDFGGLPSLGFDADHGIERVDPNPQLRLRTGLSAFNGDIAGSQIQGLLERLANGEWIRIQPQTDTAQLSRVSRSRSTRHSFRCRKRRSPIPSTQTLRPMSPFPIGMEPVESLLGVVQTTLYASIGCWPKR